jgi:hypothetical protein
MFKRGSIITAVIAVILFASFWPAAAHAMSITEFFNNPLESILIWIGDGLNVVRLVLVELISYLGTILNAVVSQPEVNYGGATVYFLWKLFRDICNLLFIVLFILPGTRTSTFIVFGLYISNSPSTIDSRPFPAETIMTTDAIPIPRAIMVKIVRIFCLSNAPDAIVNKSLRIINQS